jgi:hypothetical protein
MDTDEQVNTRELWSLVVGAVAMAVLLTIFVAVNNSHMANASNRWYLLDLYVDHHHHHHLYLPVVAR